MQGASKLLVPSDQSHTSSKLQNIRLSQHRVRPQYRSAFRPPFLQRLMVSSSGLLRRPADAGRLVRQRGQAMTEYLIIVALIAVAAIAVYQSFGQVIRAQTAGLARELAGESASQAVSAARTASGDALKQKSSKSLKSYGAKEQ